jgi:4-hydroxybenzoate polyprenyltransferase
VAGPSLTPAGRRRDPGAERPARSRVPALLAACHPEPAFAVTALATLLAVRAGRGAAGSAAVGLAVGLGQLSVGWCNDWVDAGRDRQAARADKPLASGRLRASTVGTAAVLALVAAAGASELSGWRAALAHQGALLAAWSYNLRLKATAVSVLPYLLAFGLLPAFITLGLPGHPFPPAWAFVGGALLGAGAHLANVLPDIEADRRAGVRGLPQRLGAAGSRVASMALLLAASGLFALGARPRDALSAVVLGAAAAVAGWGLWRARAPAGSRAAFRAVLVMAALDVALLAVRGATLG